MSRLIRVCAAAVFAAMICVLLTAGTAEATAKHHCKVCEIKCPEPPPCCHDAAICVVAKTSQVCYTEHGLNTFITLFREAAAKGMENAAIRAFNNTKTTVDCEPKEAKK